MADREGHGPHGQDDSPSAVAREVLVKTARSLIGVPFRHRGRDRTGVDCAGVLVLARDAALGAGDDFRRYPRDPDARLIFAALAPHADRILAADAGPGDIVLTRHGGRVRHLGLFTGTGVVHASAPRGVRESPARAICASAVAWFRFKGVGPWQR
jgi:cell wall-associated NlpC family hydrolase